MVLKISQNTFDEIVKENVEDLEMSLSEAITEAIQQFQAQGVNLSSILKNESRYNKDGTVGMETDYKGIVEKLKYFSEKEIVLNNKEVQLDEIQYENFKDILLEIKKICKTNIGEQVKLSENQLYPVIVSILSKILDCDWSINYLTPTPPYSHWSVLKDLINVLNFYVENQSDLLDDKSFEIFLKYFEIFFNFYFNSFPNQPSSSSSSSSSSSLQKADDETLLSKQESSLSFLPLSPLLFLFSKFNFMHEINKNKIIESKIPSLISDFFLQIYNYSTICFCSPNVNKLLSRSCLLLRTTIKDDDIRVVAGCCHSNIIKLVNKYLFIDRILYLFKAHKLLISSSSCCTGDPLFSSLSHPLPDPGPNPLPPFLSSSSSSSLSCFPLSLSSNSIFDLLSLLSILIAREEFCIKVYESGCLGDFMDLLNVSDYKIIKITLYVLKSLSGSDKLKQIILQDFKGGEKLLNILWVNWYLETGVAKENMRLVDKEKDELVAKETKMAEEIKKNEEEEDSLKKENGINRKNILDKNENLTEVIFNCLSSLLLRQSELAQPLVLRGREGGGEKGRGKKEEKEKKDYKLKTNSEKKEQEEEEEEDDGLHVISAKYMKLYPDNEKIQKNISIMIRNIVSRNSSLIPFFLEEGIEEILRKNIEKFEKNKDDFRYALRDLKCQVELKTLWLGKGVQLKRE